VEPTADRRAGGGRQPEPGRGARQPEQGRRQADPSGRGTARGSAGRRDGRQAELSRRVEAARRLDEARRGQPQLPATGGQPPRDLDDPRLAIDETVQFVRLTGFKRARTLTGALVITALSALVPGTGHLILRRRPTGYALVSLFVLGLLTAAFVALRVPRARLLEFALSSRWLAIIMLACVVAAMVWLVVILRTYELARPRRLASGQQLLGGFVVLLMCMGVGAPLGFAAYTANSQRNLINDLFPSGAASADGSGAPAGDVDAIKKARINILLLGSDAGSGRIGTRTDTMVVASIDTKTGRTILFSLPRNVAYAQFPADSPIADEFPNGFHDPANPTSGDYLLNAVYAYGSNYPQLAPETPSNDPGLNLLYSSISTILGLQLDFYIVVNMQGFASIIDALGGLDVNVGPERVPMGGIGPFGESVRPFGYIQPGLQHLTGEQALWFARSRTNSTDYVRMGRQRCLLQYLVDQKTPVDVLKNFQAVASATTDSVSTNIPQELLAPLVTLAGKAKGIPMESIAFDPNLPDPGQADGRFDTGNPDYDYVRQVVRNALAPPPEATQPPSAATPPPGPPGGATTTTPKKPGAGSTQASGQSEAPAPTSLEEVCGAQTP
jgi:polyisoprenyl-teichoic acid--peptidoglycan teichoic acid transferase